MHVTFTPAAEADLPELLAMARAASQAPGSHWSIDYPNLEILREDLAHNALYRIEDLNGRLIGLIAMGQMGELRDLSWTVTDSSACELSRLGLHPDCQGQGLLAPVLSQAVAYCQGLGYRTFRLLVSTDFDRAIRTYQRYGFVRTGQVHLWDEDFYQYEYAL